MAISQGSTREALAQAYTGLGSWIAVYTDPGTTEASGGGYTRVQTTWSGGTPDDGVYVGSQVEINLPAGDYSHVGIFTAQTGGTLVDKKALSEVRTLQGDGGKLLITPTVTIS